MMEDGSKKQKTQSTPPEADRSHLPRSGTSFLTTSHEFNSEVQHLRKEIKKMIILKLRNSVGTTFTEEGSSF